MTPILRQHGCPGTRREVALSSLRHLTGGTGFGGAVLGSGKVSGGQEVAEPDGKRLKNVWEAPRAGASSCAGSAVNFGAVRQAVMLVPSTLGASGKWGYWRERRETSLLPSLCLQALGVLGADSSSAPQVECKCVCTLPAALGCFAKATPEAPGG